MALMNRLNARSVWQHWEQANIMMVLACYFI
ncbi:hypothetical protein ABID39_001333 [Bartonella japonica]|uniref:Uncharacterized protein n=1 Tax=Bartonella japonica TaxID=357761 RepID=A0ABV2FPY1_9HYPH